jgi:4-hydroxy-tetrahydrodipicolinate synthase
MKLKGTYTALITPFDDNGHLDETGLIELINMQINQHVNGIVLLGTTGETATLTSEEQRTIMQIGRDHIKDKALFIVGTGSNSTQETIRKTLEAKEFGADAVLIVTPYYNKPTQEGMFQHYQSVAQAVDLPIILYSVQARTGQNLLPDTVARLSAFPNIIGIKEASGNIVQISEIIEKMRSLRPDFSVFSGDDSLTLTVMALGGDGIISVISNLVPDRVKALEIAMENKNFNLAQEIHFELMPLVRAAFIETNPMPIKALMEMADLPSGKCRLPLCELSRESTVKLRELQILSLKN